MSSIATFYVLEESQRDSFINARENEKTHSVTKGFFGIGRREIITGERYLWEYLDDEAADRHDFNDSGFAIIDYLFTYLQLPGSLQAELSAATSKDGHYTSFDHALASSLSDFLQQNPPDEPSLAGFTEKLGHKASEYVPVLTATHAALIQWFRSFSPSEFGVLHLTF